MTEATDEQQINQRIAARVRQLRAMQGLSLEALAGRSGVSRSMLSLIERGQSSPTAVVLERLASGLDVPLGRLFEDALAPASPLSHGHQRTDWRDPLSGYRRRNISPANHPSPIQLVEVWLPGGAQVVYESPPRESRIHQQIWLHQGQLEVRLGEQLFLLKADDCLAMVLDRPTGFRNPLRKTAHYLVVTAGGRPSHEGP